MTKSRPHSNKKMLIFFVICMLLWALVGIFYTDEIIKFAEQFSPDGVIGTPISIVYILLTVLLVLIFVFLLKAKSYWARFKSSNRITEKPEAVLIILLCIFHLLSYAIPHLRTYYVEDALLENMTAVFALTAGTILVFSLRFIRDKNTLKLILCCITAFYFFGLEEISWGQRIFGFDTPESIKTLNYQQETTIHNFFNPVLNYINIFLCVLVSAYYFFITKMVRLFPSSLAALLNQNNSMLFCFVFFILAIQSYFYGGELTEEVVSVLMLFASIRFFVSAKTNCSAALIIAERKSL